MRRLLPALLSWCVCVAAGAAVQPAAEPLISEAGAVLRINDLRWIERELTSFATSAGDDPTPLRGLLAEVLFRARSLAGIDLSRPAVIAWRSGRAPLIAVIPLSDRRAFLQDFGAVAAFGAPLVKIGERNGTVVYTQNTPAGLDEYRLLVQDDTAYLARTVDECRLLATHPPRMLSVEAPLSFRASGAFARESVPRLIAGLPAPIVATVSRLMQGSRLGWAAGSWTDLLDQVAQVTCAIGPGPDGTVRLQARILAKADTILAQWVSSQKNTASRLLPLVREHGTLVSLYGKFDWQGQLDRLGQRLIATARDTFAERWSPQLEEAWRGQWEIADRSGPFALALTMTAGGQEPVLRLLREQPRAQELVGLERLCTEAAPGAGAVEAITAGGLSGYRLAVGSGEWVTVADDRRQIVVAGQTGQATGLAATIADSLATPLPAPAGIPALVGMQVDLTEFVRAGLPQSHDVPVVLPQVDAALVIKATPQGNLVVESDLPFQRFAVLLRDAAAVRSLK